MDKLLTRYVFDGFFSAGCVVGCSTTGFGRYDMVFNRHSNNDDVVYALWIGEEVIRQNDGKMNLTQQSKECHWRRLKSRSSIVNKQSLWIGDLV